MSMGHGNFIRISHEIDNHYSFLEYYDNQECDYLGQSHVFNMPETRFINDFKYYCKCTKHKCSCVVKLHKTIEHK